MSFQSEQHPVNDIPIDKRIGLLISGAFGIFTLIITVTVFIIIFYFSKNEMKKDVSTLADLIGINCAAPILFNDQNAAQDILSALQAIQQIKAVYILTPDKNVFAEYHNLSEEKSSAFLLRDNTGLKSESFELLNNCYYLILPILFKGKTVGSIYIESDLERVYFRLKWFVWIAAIVFTLSGFVVGFLYAKLQSAVKALQGSESRYRRVFENTGTAMFIYDENDTINMANAMFEKFIGRSKEDIEGNLKWWELLGSGSTDLRAGLNRGDFEFTWQKSREERKYLYIKTDHLPGTGKRIVSLTDITTIRKAEEELRKSEKIKTEFIYVTSHELRTPLQSMLLGVSGLLDEEEIKNNPSLYEDVEMVSKGVTRLAQLVENLLDLSRIETDKIRLNLADTPIHTIIENVSNEVMGLAENYGHRIKFYPEKTVTSIFVDKDKIEQVFINLIGNSIKFTPDGGMIIVENWLNGKEIVFQIADNGYGIPPSVQKDIFKKFFQADSFMSDRTGGIGLGLTICKNIIDEHNGKISCTSPIPEGIYDDLPLSEERKGTLFNFSLPVKGPVKK